MPKPGENKTVQSLILSYAQEIGVIPDILWTISSKVPG
jgi:hypothetical protein